MRRPGVRIPSRPPDFNDPIAIISSDGEDIPYENELESREMTERKRQKPSGKDKSS